MIELIQYSDVVVSLLKNKINTTIWFNIGFSNGIWKTNYIILIMNILVMLI